MSAAIAPPILHILAGPNGAGKTTLYEAWVKRLTDAEFVNADQLCQQVLDRHALTREDAQLGQRLANERRSSMPRTLTWRENDGHGRKGRRGK
jgi:predicted ABC-type ATPase